MKDSNIREFGAWLSEHTWSEITDVDNVDHKCSAFYNTLNAAMELYFPQKSVKFHSSDKPSSCIKVLVKKRQKAFNDGNMVLWRYFRNKVARAIKYGKHKYYSEKVKLLKQTNPSSWFREISFMSGRNAKCNTQVNVEGVDPLDHRSIASAICSKFSSVNSDLSPLDVSALPTYLPARPIPLVNTWEVFKVLDKLKRNKACGPDNIPSRLIRKCAYELAKPLTIIINCSLAQHRVPSQWKRAITVPVPKSTPATVENLRPIALIILQRLPNTLLLRKLSSKWNVIWTPRSTGTVEEFLRHIV